MNDSKQQQRRGSVVYAPQQPSKFDSQFQIWTPTVDLTPALKFGELRVMLPPSFGALTGAPAVQALKERMTDFAAQDYLLAVGDPMLIAAAAGIAALRTGGKLKMLKWDRFTKDYLAVELQL